MDAENWGTLIGQTIGASGRADAQFRAALAVAQNPSSLKPLVFSHPAEWDNDETGARKHQFVETLRNNSGSVADMRELAQANPLAFGEWRRAVSDHEAQNAAKLQVLVWVLRCMHSRLDDDEDGLVAKFKYRVQEHLAMDWGIHEFPLEGDYRPWCVQSTRNLRLLPVAWRFV